MTHHHGALGAFGVIATGTVLSGSERRTVRLGASEDVMAVRRVTAPVNHLALFAQRGVLAEIVRRAMQVSDILRNRGALGVHPRAAADAILGVDGIRTLCREIGVPRLAASARRLRERLAVPVRALDPAEIAALSGTRASDEEGHRVLRLCEADAPENRNCGSGDQREFDCPVHPVSSVFVCRYR